jgi:hypothetical protein
MRPGKCNGENVRGFFKSTILLIAMSIAGCAQHQPQLVGDDPHALVQTAIEPWTFDGEPGRTLVTDHYLIHTTIADDDFLESLAAVMEGSLQLYQHLTPGITLSPRPMECYVFSQRPQWAKFTQQHTGEDAAIYLQINRGGYTVRDWFVAYFIGDAGTWSVASHEGWHQYVARYFHSRLPPFLEEGIATTFENITWSGRTPRWNLAMNVNRAEKLRAAIENRWLWPLDKLCMMHAGDVVSLSSERIETFYAQDWAFAQFLNNADNGRYRAAFAQMLDDLADGTADKWTGGHRGPSYMWAPSTVRPLLEHYLGMNMKEIDAAYQAYIREIAFGVRESQSSS